VIAIKKNDVSASKAPIHYELKRESEWEKKGVQLNILV
jgi:hypothetical protein